MKPERRTLVICAALPPPVEGHAVITRAIEAQVRLSTDVNVETLDISPGTATRGGVRYHLTRIRRCLIAATKLVQSRRSESPTAYFVYEAGLGVVYNLALVCAARLSGFKVLLHHHTSAHTKRRRQLFRVLKFVAGSDCIHIVLSPAMAKDLCAQYGNLQTFVCGNVVLPPSRATDTKQFREPKVIRLGMLSNLTVEKGSIVAIDCLRALLASGIDAELTMAGPVNDEETAVAMRNARVEFPKSFSYLGAIYGDAKDAFYESLDIFVLPTTYRYEAQPLVILEALSCGVPVIATNSGYIPEMLPYAWLVDFAVARFDEAVVKMCSDLLVSNDALRVAKVEALNTFKAHEGSSRQGSSGLITLLTECV